MLIGMVQDSTLFRGQPRARRVPSVSAPVVCCIRSSGCPATRESRRSGAVGFVADSRFPSMAGTATTAPSCPHRTTVGRGPVWPRLFCSGEQEASGQMMAARLSLLRRRTLQRRLEVRPRLIAMGSPSDTEPVRRVATEVEPAALVEQLAGIVETARPIRVTAGHVRVDGREVDRLVKAINTASGSLSHRDWRVTVSTSSPRAAVANEAREAVERCRKSPLSADDVLLPGERASQLANTLQRRNAVAPCP